MAEPTWLGRVQTSMVAPGTPTQNSVSSSFEQKAVYLLTQATLMNALRSQPLTQR